MQHLPDTTIRDIKHLFQTQGNAAYFGEAVTQYEHAVQCAFLAQEAGYDKEVIWAALLHDIGHLLPSERYDEHMDEYGRHAHEELAAQWLLERGFSNKTAELVAQHVNAKRYLIYAVPEYYKQLSDASRKTLAFQGGIMSPVEAAIFEQHPYFHLILEMRRWDEQAKMEGIEVPSLSYFLEKL